MQDFLGIQTWFFQTQYHHHHYSTITTIQEPTSSIYTPTNPFLQNQAWSQVELRWKNLTKEEGKKKKKKTPQIKQLHGKITTHKSIYIKKKKKTAKDQARSCRWHSSPAQQFLLIVKRGSIMGEEIWVTPNPRSGPLFPILIFSSCTSPPRIGFSLARTYPSRPTHSRFVVVSRGSPNTWNMLGFSPAPPWSIVTTNNTKMKFSWLITTPLLVPVIPNHRSNSPPVADPSRRQGSSEIFKNMKWREWFDLTERCERGREERVI